MRQGGSQNTAVQRGELWSWGTSVSHRVYPDGSGGWLVKVGRAGVGRW